MCMKALSDTDEAKRQRDKRAKKREVDVLAQAEAKEVLAVERAAREHYFELEAKVFPVEDVDDQSLDDSGDVERCTNYMEHLRLGRVTPPWVTSANSAKVHALLSHRSYVVALLTPTPRCTSPGPGDSFSRSAAPTGQFCLLDPGSCQSPSPVQPTMHASVPDHMVPSVWPQPAAPLVLVCAPADVGPWNPDQLVVGRDQGPLRARTSTISTAEGRQPQVWLPSTALPAPGKRGDTPRVAARD